jgi:hypothetical protein
MRRTVMNRTAPVSAPLDTHEQRKRDFLNHLAASSKMVEGWPAWKTGLWKTDSGTPLDTQALPPPVAEITIFGNECKEVAWANGKMPAVGAKLYDDKQVEQIVAPYAEHIKKLEREGSGVITIKGRTYTADEIEGRIHDLMHDLDVSDNLVRNAGDEMQKLEREHGLLEIVCEQQKARIASADARIAEVERELEQSRAAFEGSEAARKDAERARAAAPVVEAPRSREWQPVTGPGQVRKGDKLRFKIGDKVYDERAKLILNPGADKEEVIYDKGRNFYFITAMVMSGFSNHKCVEVLAAAPTPTNSGMEETNAN